MLLFCHKVLGHANYSLLGWSDGGITAIIMAAMQPDRVRKLVVWGANAYMTPEEAQSYDALNEIDIWSERMKKLRVEVYEQDYLDKIWKAWVDSFARYMATREGWSTKGNVCIY